MPELSAIRRSTVYGGACLSTLAPRVQEPIAMMIRHPLLASLLAAAALVSGAVMGGSPTASAAGQARQTRDTIIPPTITDFNGDGYADLAVAGLNDPAGSVAAAGGVNVIYGSSNGLQATAPDDQFWSA